MVVGEARPYEDICSKCENKKLIRFECNNEYSNKYSCVNKYCFKCSRSQAILRTASHLMCFNHHEFVYVHRKLQVLQAKTAPIRCDLCLNFNEHYFSDRKCGLQICQACCAEFTVD